MPDLVLVGATILMGLAAGLFYGFSCAVMPGLRATDDRTFVSVMQRINAAILNGWFAIVFGGAPVAMVLAAGLQWSHEGNREVLPWILAALLLDLLMILITMRINVPMNEALAAADVSTDARILAALRARFETKWVRWNNLRALIATAAFCCLVCGTVWYSA
ncbi:anthrone oxygenase family protein [Actinoalloteichus hymeniacidonis]|uniref:Integral membrane protein n=1 Tax=Actinoalloteichus hymeniacidonis TaxID=340345 RepID=A0AAC9HMB0_9PSEU|nr:anthrone oxygenase family protein [Actinoalloteichus hymeniacidonis]AOS61401.1 putative integral membrane protein [Actinoalloteichus hymeniacidonis]MBB5910594.1 putative membrane protein [Actinoalloteichus hymeniacidonis]